MTFLEAEPEKNPVAARLLIWSCRYRFPVLGRAIRIVLGSDFFVEQFGTNLKLPHPYGIVAHSKVVLGDHVTILQGVTLGGSKPGSGVPRVGNHVLVGAGAKVLGGITVGDNVKIGANAVVTKDVPAGTTVIGVNQHLP
jgi:serine O-acetyltransferase